MARETDKASPAAATPGAAVESVGVDALISRLRDAGIEEGRSQSEALVKAARQQASDIVAAATREADGILVKAKEEAAKLKAAGEDAVRLAMRDTILSLEGDLLSTFQNRLRALVRGALEDQELLQRLILEVASKAAPAAAEGGRAEVLLPPEFASLDELRRKPEEAKPGTLMHFVLSLGGDVLREGVGFAVGEDGQAGIRVRLVDDDMRIDLTDTAVSELLLRHLLPRFRALLRGAVIGSGDTPAGTAGKRVSADKP